MIPLSHVLTVSSTSGTSSAPSMSLSIVGTASSTTAPFTIATETCPTPPSMPPTNPPITVPPLPGSLVVLATSPFQSHAYSVSPSPSPQIRTTPPLEYPDSSAQVTLPTLEPRTYPLSLTSHWGDCHPNWSATPLQPPTWTHPRSTPLSMPSLRLQTAVISNISARSGPRTKNTRLRSTSSRKTSSTPCCVSSTIRRPVIDLTNEGSSSDDEEL